MGTEGASYYGPAGKLGSGAGSRANVGLEDDDVDGADDRGFNTSAQQKARPVSGNARMTGSQFRQSKSRSSA